MEKQALRLAADFDIVSVFHLNFILLVIPSETHSELKLTEGLSLVKKQNTVSEAETKMMERHERSWRREVEMKREEERIKHQY